MSTAQIVFSIALAVVALVIVLFSLFMLNTTIWGNRWIRQPKHVTRVQSEEEAS